MTWGEWAVESDTVSVRNRECKNKGANVKCRGKTTQKRFREVKKGTEPEFVIEGKLLTMFIKVVSRLSITLIISNSGEVPEDWGPWGEWTQESTGVFVRKRTCLNKTGKCRGNSVQKKTVTVTDEYEVEIDKGNENVILTTLNDVSGIKTLSHFSQYRRGNG